MAIKLLIKLRGSLIRAVPGVEENLKKIMLKAFNVVKTKAQLPKMSDQLDMAVYLLTDPMYLWIAREYTEQHPSVYMADVNKILNTSLEDLEVNTMFNNVVKFTMSPSLATMVDVCKDGGYLTERNPPTAKYITLLERFAKLRLAQKEEIFDWLWKRVRVYKQFNMIRRNFVMEANLAQKYCADGTRHKWTTFVYNEGGKLVEYTNKTLNDRKEAYLYDQKCEKCGMYLSKMTPAVSKKLNILEQIRAHSERQNFFYFYFTACPEEGFHEWEHDVCKKCKISSKQLETQPDEYYNKYFKKFIEQRQQSRLKINIRHQDLTIAQHGSKYKKLPDIKNGPELLGDILKGMSIKLHNIGAVNGLDADFVEKYIVEKINHHVRVQNLINYITIATNMFNKLVNYTNEVTDVNVKKIIDAVPTPTKILKSIPNVWTDINNIISEHIYNTKNYEEFSKWLHNALCLGFVDIISKAPPAAKKIMDLYVRTTIGVILEYDALLVLRRQPFNWQKDDADEPAEGIDTSFEVAARADADRADYEDATEAVFKDDPTEPQDADEFGDEKFNQFSTEGFDWDWNEDASNDADVVGKETEDIVQTVADIRQEEDTEALIV
jgi:hypothetical protein